jgi:hypothetical protein
MKKTLLALMAAALAGCAGSPNWKEPERNQKPIVLEDEVDAPKKPAIDTPAVPDSGKQIEPAGGYGIIELEVAYKFDNSIAANGFDGYVKFLEDTVKRRELTDYEKMEVAFQINKEGNISTKDLSKRIEAFTLEFVEGQEEDLRRVYTERIAVATEEAGAELAKLIDGKSDAEKAKVAKGVRAVYNGKDPLTLKQVRKIQEYK